jgi:hypothetical protein
MASLAIPFVVVIAVSLTRTWWPWGDQALIELRTHDVGGPLNPLVGSYSRFGWYHPGPLGFWVLAAPYRLLGARPAGMLVASALVHASAIGGCLVLAHRRGGRPLAALCALTLALLLRGFGLDAVVDVWNPYLPMFALAFLVLATWSVLEGEVGLLPVVVAVSCLAWQTHIGYLPVSVMLAAVALGGGAWRLIAARTGRSAGDGDDGGGDDGDGAPAARRWRRPAVIGALTLATAIVCLAPIALDQLTVTPGNLGAILTSLNGGQGPAIGRRAAVRIAGAYLAPGGVWLTSIDTAQPMTTQLVPLRAGALGLVASFGAVAAALVLARRAGAHGAARFAALTGASAAVGVVSVSRTVGEPVYPYLFTWLLPVSALLWLSVAWCAFEVLRRAPRVVASGVGRWAPAAAAAVALVTAGVAGATATAKPVKLPGEDAAIPVGAFAPAALRVTAGVGLVRLRAGQGACRGETPPGLAAVLAEHGTDVAVDDDSPVQYGRGRVRPDRLPVLDVVCGPDASERARRGPEAPIATVNLLPPDETTELRALSDGFRRQLEEDHRPDLVAAAEHQGPGSLVDLAAVDHPFDPARVARYDALLQKGRTAGALFWRPEPGDR